MCTKEEFAHLRDVVRDAMEQSAENSRQIAELQRSNAVQSEQIKTLFTVTEKQGEHQDALTTRLVWAVIAALFLALSAVLYGALGEKGFNAVTSAAQEKTQLDK